MTILISNGVPHHSPYVHNVINCVIMSNINIKHIKNLHNDWLRGLEFYKQEIEILQNRLDEITADNTGKEASEEI